MFESAIPWAKPSVPHLSLDLLIRDWNATKNSRLFTMGVGVGDQCASSSSFIDQFGNVHHYLGSI